MESNLESGRKQLLSVIAVAIGVSVVILALMGRTRSMELLAPQLIRLGATLLLCYFLYKKHVWARWVSEVLFALGGLGALAGSLALVGKSRSAWVVLAIATGYVYCAAALLFSKDIAAYMGGVQALEQKAEPIEEKTPEEPVEER